MSRHVLPLRVAALAGTVAAVVLGTAVPAAAADVTVEPASAPQGGPANLTFRVTNPGPSAITRVRLVMPKDTPVAEVFPLSVPEWAPQIENTKLATPLTGTHGGAAVTETAGAITWTAVRGKAIAPGRSADLPVALGPLPTVSRMSFTLEPTYADGRTGPALAPVTLTLVPAAGGAATGHSGAGSGTGVSDAEEAAFRAVVAQADDGGGFWSTAGWVVAALAVAGAAVVALRGRRRTEPEADDGMGDEAEEAPADEAAEPVAAGARVTSWSYRDGP